MNNDAEAMQQFVVWLLQTLDPANGAPSGDWNQAAEPEQTGSGEPSPLAFGDIPAVQQRFHALLKHRLKTEIERNPPRFPWETEQHDYQYDNSCGYESCETESPFIGGRSNSPGREPVFLGAAQLKTLNLPIALPDVVLQTLFEQCRHLIQSSLREGRRLVQAVEALFPEEEFALNQLAGLVLTSPLRGGTAALPKSSASLPTDYSQASRPQQMVLSLLAARQLFEAMTLILSSDALAARRTWQTEAGGLMLEAQYSPESSTVQIKAQLPIGGTVRFQQAALESIASCDPAGSVSLSLSPLHIDQPAILTIELAESDVPLVFAVRLVSEQQKSTVG